MPHIYQKIAARFMRLGGILKPPPKFTQDVSDFCLGKYAGHVLEQALRDKRWCINRINKYEEHKKIEKRANEALDKLDSFDLLDMEIGEVVDFKIQKYRNNDSIASSYEIERNEEKSWTVTSYKHGTSYHHTFKTTYDTHDHIFNKFIEIISEISGYEKKLKKYQSELVDAQRLINECKKYTDKAKSYKHSARTEIKIDISGWEYEDKIQDEALLYLIKPVEVILFFSGHKRRSGQWTSTDRELQVDVYREPRSVREFKRYLGNIDKTVVHECRHVAQTLLAKSGYDSAGYPKEEYGDPKYNPSGYPASGYGGRQQEHALRDVEFETRLGDEVFKYQREVQEIPYDVRKNFLRMWIANFDRNDTLEFQKATQGRRPPHRKFFQMLKGDQPEKYRLAVKKFLAAIDKLGLYIPERIDLP